MVTSHSSRVSYRSVSSIVSLQASRNVARFLDIETTGLSPYYDRVTLAGWSCGWHVHGPWSTLARLSNSNAICTALRSS